MDELLRGKKTEMEKIAALTHWVADNMRYSGISMGKGEGYTLHTTKMNFTDRCGVCKDKAALLISMLRMAGFEAYPAMTMAGSRIETIPADHFNHCVTVVKLSSGQYIPLDPTWVPFLRELWSSAERIEMRKAIREIQKKIGITTVYVMIEIGRASCRERV